MVISDALVPVPFFGTEQGHLSNSDPGRRAFDDTHQFKAQVYAVRPPEGIFSYDPQGQAITEFPTGKTLDIYV
jgi:hypothetical protein